jgi:hypothetical protein
MLPIPRRSRPALFRLAAATIVVMPLLWSCSNNQTDNGAGTETDATTGADDGSIGNGTLPTFQASSPATGARVDLEGAWDDATQHVRVRLYIAGFANVLGLAGHLRFDPAVLKLVTLTGSPVPLGPAKDALTWEARTMAKESPAGRVLLGGARFRKKPNPYVGPEGAVVDRELWVTLEFEVLQSGTHTIAFDPGSTTARNDGNEEVSATWGSGQIVWKQGGVK